MTVSSCSTPLASLWTKPDCLFQSVPISHSLCHHSHHSCCFSLGSCCCVPMFSELENQRRMFYSSCILAITSLGLLVIVMFFFFTDKNMMLMIQIWALSILFKFPLLFCRIWILFFIFCNMIIQL